jgi:hypothetical protein
MNKSTSRAKLLLKGRENYRERICGCNSVYDTCIFAQAAHCTMDSFWIEALKYAHYGMSPRGTQITLSFIKYKDQIEITKKDPFGFLKQVKRAFRALGLDSPFDKHVYRLDELISECDAEIVDWKKIRRKNNKDNLIIMFVREVGERYKLTTPQRNRLRLLLVSSLRLKKISSEDILISNNRIKSVKGLKYHDGEFKIHTGRRQSS